MDAIQLTVKRDGGRTLLVSPEVGWFTCAVPKGRLFGGGEEAGRIEVLGVSHPVVVPAGVRGRVVNEVPERVHEPVAYGTVLYELEPIGDVPVEDTDRDEVAAAAGLAVRAPHTGRFWHRAAPGTPAMTAVGEVLEEGSPVGLIEVMKTFTQVRYRATGGLPERARVTRILVDDGAETEEGAALVEVEPA